MQVKSLLFLSIIILIILTNSSYAKEEYTFVTGNWLGKSHFKKNGRFKSCTMSAKYQSGTEIYFVINQNLGWALGFNNSDLNLNTGERNQAKLQIDENPERIVQTQNLSKNGFYILFNKKQKLLDELKQGRQLVIRMPGLKANYELKGTAKAIPNLVGCAVARSNLIKTLNESVTSSSEQQNYSSQENSETAEKKPELKNNEEEIIGKRQKAIEYVERLLQNRGISGYKIIASNKHPIRGYDVMWHTSSQDLGGIQFIKSKNDQSIDKLAGNIIGNDAAFCEGEFASAKKLIDNNQTNNTRNISIVCRRQNDSYEIQYFIFKRKDGVYVKIAQKTVLSLSSQNKLRDQNPLGLWNNPDQSIIDILPK